MSPGRYERELEEVLRVGVAMRAAQKNYFKTRDSGVLAMAKALEKEFDKLAGVCLSPPDLLS